MCQEDKGDFDEEKLPKNEIWSWILQESPSGPKDETLSLPILIVS